MKALLPFFIANALVHTLNAVYYSFIPKYLKDIAEKTDGEIGIILSVGPLVGIVSLIFFGIVSDKAKYKNNVLIVTIALCAVMFYMIRLNNSLLYLIIIFAFFMFFMSPYTGLLDAICLEYTTAERIKYGPIRVTGTICFGAAAMILTLVLTFLGDYADVKIIFPVFAFTALFCVIAIKKIPPVKGHARGKQNVSYREFFKDKMMITLFVIIFAVQFSFGAYYNFMQNFLEKTLNQPPWVWGVAVVFTIVGETIFFFKFEYFFKRFSIKTIVIFGVFTQVLRHLSLAFLPYGAAILITSLFTGSFTVVIFYAAAYYINMTVQKEMRAFGQTLLYSLSFSIPRFLAGILGGLTVERLGFTNLMMICAVINLIIFIATKFMPFKSVENQ